MSDSTTVCIGPCPTCGGPAQMVGAEYSDDGTEQTIHIDLAEYNRGEVMRLRALIDLAASYIARQPSLQTPEAYPAARQLVDRLRAAAPEDTPLVPPPPTPEAVVAAEWWAAIRGERSDEQSAARYHIDREWPALSKALRSLALTARRDEPAPASGDTPPSA